MTPTTFGIEAEYALIRPDGRFADFTNTDYAELRALLAPLPDYRHPELRVGDVGIRVKNWYVEGDERFDRAGRSTGLAVKGIEIRTPVCATVEKGVESLQHLRAMLAAALGAQGWGLAAIGFNPCTAAYRPRYARWERQFHASHAANALPGISTLSYGPDLNFSSPGGTAAAALETVRRLTYYSPWIVPFSFSAPFHAGALWEGLSYRTFRRTGPRPAALAHLAGETDHPLVRPADPPSQHLRIEFKAFDMVADDRLLAELFHLVLGIALADPGALPGRADVPDAQRHQRAALSAFEDAALRDESARITAAAQTALRAHGLRDELPLLEDMLTTRRTPAHAMRDHFARTGTLFAPLGAGRHASSGHFDGPAGDAAAGEPTGSRNKAWVPPR